MQDSHNGYPWRPRTDFGKLARKPVGRAERGARQWRPPLGLFCALRVPGRLGDVVIERSASGKK